jgi:FkbM family methyltransferase
MENMSNIVNKTLLETLDRAVLDYVQEPENPELNYRVALLYEQLGQWAAALSFFLRTAERTPDKNLTYECLIKIGLMFDRPRGRGNSVRGMYKKAMLICPTRPEAYFLLARHYEREKDYVSSYTWACLGEQFSDIDSPPLRSWIEYPGRYAIKFEKAVAGWWWGHEKESRRLFRELAEEYHGLMDDPHAQATYNNIANLGIGREEVTHKKYKPEMWSKLRYQFNGSGNIKSTHGQVYQDLFVLACLDGKRNGRYLEIGSAGPYYGNNTALLEEEFGWYGVGIDFDEKFVKDYREKRKNKILHSNALEVDYNNLLSELAVNGVVDYLQLDCEPSSVTYDIMTKIPFDKFKFAVITYEHDHYLDRSKSYRKKSRDFLTSRGYELVVSDVSPEGHSSFEDWYVHPDLVDRKIIDRMKDIIPGDFTTSIRTIDDYMFPKPKPSGFENFDWGTLTDNSWFFDILQEEFSGKTTYQRFFEVEKDDVVFDIGSSAGPFAYSIVKNEPKEIHCFEPEDTLFNTLVKNMSQFPDKQIKLNKLAIAHVDGEFETTGLYDPTEREMHTKPPVKVSSISFKTYIEQNNISQIDFMKLDCEGGEYDIFNDDNMDWILQNVKKIAGEWHLTNPEQKAKFTHFKNTYLKKFENFRIFSMWGYEITHALWLPDNEFDRTWGYFTIYIDNQPKKEPEKIKFEINFPAHIIKKKNNKKEYWRRTQWPTLEITTNIAEKGCVVDCVFCPQRILERSYKSDKRIMTLDEFKFMIDKVPQEVRITFAGFTEPWLNKYCTDMALYAHEKGHPISAFTTAVGMTPEDVERLSAIPFVGNPNGGFCLHLPDQEEFAKHPINANYIRTIQKFKELQPKLSNFYTMCMSENVHESVKHIFPYASVPTFWNRAGNLVGEAVLKPELDKIKERWKSFPESKDPRTCGCIEDLYHNVLLPNGDVSLCCMDYSLEYILGNLNTQEYDDIVPVPNTTYDMCRKCENGVVPKDVQIQF